MARAHNKFTLAELEKIVRADEPDSAKCPDCRHLWYQHIKLRGRFICGGDVEKEDVQQCPCDLNGVDDILAAAPGEICKVCGYNVDLLWGIVEDYNAAYDKIGNRSRKIEDSAWLWWCDLQFLLGRMTWIVARHKRHVTDQSRIEWARRQHQEVKDEQQLITYFIQIGKGDQAIKIGKTRQIAKRLGVIQTSSPYQIKILLLLDGIDWPEKELHRRFRDLQITFESTSHEWFRPHSDLLQFIDYQKSAGNALQWSNLVASEKPPTVSKRKMAWDDHDKSTRQAHHLF